MSVRAPVGPINFAIEQICIGRGLAAIRAGEKIQREFLFYLLLYMQDQIKGNKGAVFASISKKQIENIRFNMPPLSVQDKIVAVFDKFETKRQLLINAHETKIRLLSELKHSALRQAFAEKLTGDVAKQTPHENDT